MHQSSRFQIKVAQEVLDEAIMDNKPHYLIKWKYLPHEYDTWESLEHLQSIVGMIQKWIRTKRETRQATTMSNAASYCDTVNYIDPMKKTRRKRRTIHKKHKSLKLNNEIVVLDEEDEEEDQEIENMNFIKHQQSHIYHDQSSQIIEEEKQKRTSETTESKWGVNTRSAKIQHIEEKGSQLRYPLNFDPQKVNFNPQKTRQTKHSELTILKTGMKVIGRVRSQDIEEIIEHFMFKETLCFKIELSDGRITNMREDDVKKLCPQMLMEYYEDNGIKI